MERGRGGFDVGVGVKGQDQDRDHCTSPCYKLIISVNNISYLIPLYSADLSCLCFPAQS